MPFNDELPIEQHIESASIGSRLFPDVGRRARIGRFTVLRTLGKGGMGVVFAAYDEALDRKVAVKLLRANVHSPTAKVRLLREAQALARLSHPNVVQVHEVGEHEGSVFVAMEFVAGQTLRDHQLAHAEQPESWRATLALMIQAGRGLEAAHEAGLVHRDFKPGNVMVGDDGRVRVLDFGLVRGVAPSREDTEIAETHDDELDASVPLSDSRTLLQRTLTMRGMVMGTPSYMAPEQYRGEPCDALADQFAFCVASFELLLGRRPFAGTTLEELSRNVSDGSIVSIAHPGEVPAKVRAAIERGLSPQRERRWPDMGALLLELELALAPARRRSGWIAAAVLGTALAATASLLAVDDQRAPMCALDEHAFVGIWDADRQAQLEQAYLAADRPFASRSAEQVVHSLDRWTQTWRETQQQACTATRVSGVQSEMLLDLRIACLDRRRHEFEALVEVFSEAEHAVGHVDELLGLLPDLGACSDADSLNQPFALPSDPDRAAAIQWVRDQLTGTRARALIGEDLPAYEQLREFEVQAASIDYPPVALELRTAAGELLLRRHEFQQGVEDLLAVVHEARALGLDDHAAAALVVLSSGTAGNWSHPQQEQWLLADARASLARLARPDDPRVLELLAAEARLACQAGEHQRALALLEQALAQAQRHDRADLSASLLREVAGELTDLARYDEAKAVLERALEQARSSFGDAAPTVARVHLDAGLFALWRGEFDEARARLQTAREVFVAAYGPGAAWVAHTDLARAQLAMNLGEFAEAEALVDAILPVFEHAFGPVHELTGQAFNARGVLRYFAGDYRGSLDAYQRSLTILRALLGDAHEEIGTLHSNIGESQLALGEQDLALAEFGQAISILSARDSSSAPEHPRLAMPLKGRAQVLLARGHRAEAIADFERAQAILAASAGDPIELAEIRFGLATALRDEGREPERARELAEAAELAFVQFGLSERAQAVADWLAR